MNNELCFRNDTKTIYKVNFYCSIPPSESTGNQTVLGFLFYRSVIVHVYAVRNDITNDVKNLQLEKTFLKNGDLIERLQLNLNEIPTVSVEGKS